MAEISGFCSIPDHYQAGFVFLDTLRDDFYNE
jgi:hypothetical protein